MKYKSVVAFAGLLLLLVFQTSVSGQNDPWTTHIQTGDNALSQKRYPNAEQSYREALKLTEKFKERDGRIAVNLIKLAECLNLDKARAIRARLQQQPR